MANRPFLRPNAPEPDRDRKLPSAPEPLFEQDFSQSVTRLTKTLSQYVGGAASADLAVDLVLNEIVEQARLATNASGAAIALMRGVEMICRATTGENAPGLGVPLDMRSGLSAASVKSRRPQICFDTERDSRVDVEACRILSVRSILVLPITHGDEMLGIFEIFSPRPNSFSERDVLTLQALVRRIIAIMRNPSEPQKEETRPVAREQQVSSSQTPAAPVLQDFRDVIPARKRDYPTSILTALVVTLAIVLGWMIGRVGWNRAMRKNHSPAIVAPAASQVAQKSGDAVPAPAVPASIQTETSGVPSAPPHVQPGGLTVSEGGRIVFKITPRVARRLERGNTPKPANEQLSSEASNTYLLSKVEPEYPEAARAQRIEGPVVLNALVSKDGLVEELRVLSGNPQLTGAAADAVKKWRFKPYSPKGTPLEFETRVTVNFSLPKQNPQLRE